MLEQVVVIGYGTQKKSDLTGSVAVVDTEALKQTSHSNISTMLEGKVSGVQVTSDGSPVPTLPSVSVASDLLVTLLLFMLSMVSPWVLPSAISLQTNIETIQILKDASAAAIYGSRAANGVVIITTKRGQKDQPLKVDYNGYVGMDYIPVVSMT